MPSSRSEDPVYFNFPLPIERDFAPLGFRLSVATNCKSILAAFDRAWSPFPARFSNKPLQIRVAVGSAVVGPEGDMPASGPIPKPIVRAQGNLISFIGDAQNFSIGDLSTGFGYCWFNSDLAGNQEFLRYHYLDSLVLTLIDNLYASSLHAACVMLDGSGVLLCGNSEAGKSSLAYACARAGWGYLCDDATSLLRDTPYPTVIGNPYHLRLRPDAGRLFPEFQDRLARARPNGKMSIEIATSEELEIQLVSECRPQHVVFLDRRGDGDATASVRKFPREKALRHLAGTISIGSPDQVRARLDQYGKLLELPLHSLSYGSLSGAVDCLTKLVRNGN